jgi:hypothetical protein
VILPLGSGRSLLHGAVLPSLLGAALAVASCGGSTSEPAGKEASASTASTIRVTFTGTPGRSLTRADVRVAGNISVAKKIVSSGGGRVSPQQVHVEGARRSAARFPAFDARAGAPASAVLLRSRSDPDELDPGDRPFRFGAVVRVDKQSESASAGSTDNGNNVIQKGLYVDPSQYKLQVDHGHASCRVAGSGGSLSVRSRAKARPGVWYRLTCARSDGSLAITVSALKVGGTKRLDHRVVSGATGQVGTAGESPYLSVGAKVVRRGSIPTTSTDQFNGLVRSVFVRISRHG